MTAAILLITLVGGGLVLGDRLFGIERLPALFFEAFLRWPALVAIVLFLMVLLARKVVR